MGEPLGLRDLTCTVVLPGDAYWDSAVTLKRERAIRIAATSGGWTGEEVAVRMARLSEARTTDFHDAALRREIDGRELVAWICSLGRVQAYAVFSVAGLLGPDPRIAFVPDVAFRAGAAESDYAAAIEALAERAATRGAVRMQISMANPELFAAACALGGQPVRHVLEYEIGASKPE